MYQVIVGTGYPELMQINVLFCALIMALGEPMTLNTNMK